MVSWRHPFSFTLYNKQPRRSYNNSFIKLNQHFHTRRGNPETICLRFPSSDWCTFDVTESENFNQKKILSLKKAQDWMASRVWKSSIQKQLLHHTKASLSTARSGRNFIIKIFSHSFVLLFCSEKRRRETEKLVYRFSVRKCSLSRFAAASNSFFFGGGMGGNEMVDAGYEKAFCTRNLISTSIRVRDRGN